jgi:hypothetical protein
MSRFFPTKKTRNNFLLLSVCNILFIVWLRHVGYIHMAMFFITCIVVTNTLAIYSNKRTAGYNAGRNNLIANAGPLLFVYGATQMRRYVESHPVLSGETTVPIPVGSQWGLLYMFIGVLIMIIPFANAGGDAGADVVMGILDPQEENLTRKEKIKLFFFGALKALVFLAIFTFLFFYWKQKDIENKDRKIRDHIAQTDRAIDTCDNNVKLAQEWLAQGYGDMGHAQQWREQSARYADEKAKLEAQLSTASPAETADTAPSTHGGSVTIPQPTNRIYYH